MKKVVFCFLLWLFPACGISISELNEGPLLPEAPIFERFELRYVTFGLPMTRLQIVDNRRFKFEAGYPEDKANFKKFAGEISFEQLNEILKLIPGIRAAKVEETPIALDTPPKPGANPATIVLRLKDADYVIDAVKQDDPKIAATHTLRNPSPEAELLRKLLAKVMEENYKNLK